MPWYWIDKPISGRIVRRNWGDKVVEDLNFLYYRGGYRVVGDFLPADDLRYLLGSEILRWKEVHGGQGHFTYGVRPADLPDLPAAIEGNRMKVVTVRGGVGVSDLAYILLKGSDDILRWIFLKAG